MSRLCVYRSKRCRQIAYKARKFFRTSLKGAMDRSLRLDGPLGMQHRDGIKDDGELVVGVILQCLCQAIAGSGTFVQIQQQHAARVCNPNIVWTFCFQ